MGGEAVSNGDRRLRLGGRPAPDQHRHRDLRRPARGGQQRRHPARPGAGQHDRGRVGRRHQRAPQGHLRAQSLGRRLLARAEQGRQAGRRPHHQHHLGRASTATPARPTTARPRPASPPSPTSPPRSSAATASPSTPSAPVALTRMTEGLGPAPETDEEREDAVAALDRPDRHLARQRGVGRRHRPRVRGQPARRWRSPRAGCAARSTRRSTTPRSSARSWPSCSHRPVPTRA
jgi:hypothetical protein